MGRNEYLIYGMNLTLPKSGKNLYLFIKKEQLKRK